MLLISLTGCNKVTVNAIYPEDLFNMPKGTTYTATKDGKFFSDVAVDKILQARLDLKK